jgi:hypothetical protein
MMKGFKTEISKDQARDTGMAMVLILLLAGLFTQNDLYTKIAIPVLIVNMTAPMLFYPIAVVWLKLSHVLGTIVSKVILTIIFIVLVIPVGLLWRLIGKDPLKLKKFKKGNESVMIIRNHVFRPKDLEKPY